MNRLSSPTINKEMAELNRLYSRLVPVYYSSLDMLKKKDLLSEKLKLISKGVEHDKRLIIILSDSHNNILNELQVAESEYRKIKSSMDEADILVNKLRKLDQLKSELKVFRRRSAETRIALASLSGKIWARQEEHETLKQERKKVHKEHAQLMKARRKVIELRLKVLPAGELIELKGKLSSESTLLVKSSGEVSLLKGKLSEILPVKESLEDELNKTELRLARALEKIEACQEKIKRISPKVSSKEDVLALEEKVEHLKTQKRELSEENKKISPKVAEISNEEEKITSIRDAFKLKNKKESDRLEELKSELKGVDVSDDSMNRLREKVRAIESEVNMKKTELKNVNAEYTEVQKANQGYKKIIDEVEKSSKKLKSLLRKK